MRPNAPADLWDRVAIGEADECWPWTGYVRPNGYGAISIGGRPFSTHRVAYELATGTHPGDLFVLHTCDNPPCCNPAHLVAGTPRDNTLDALRKGRMVFRCGSQHGQAKLTECQVEEIRRRRHQGEKNVALAAEFSVSPATITRITKREGWRHAA